MTTARRDDLVPGCLRGRERVGKVGDRAVATAAPRTKQRTRGPLPDGAATPRDLRKTHHRRLPDCVASEYGARALSGGDILGRARTQRRNHATLRGRADARRPHHVRIIGRAFAHTQMRLPLGDEGHNGYKR